MKKLIAGISLATLLALAGCLGGGDDEVTPVDDEQVVEADGETEEAPSLDGEEGEEGEEAEPEPIVDNTGAEMSEEEAIELVVGVIEENFRAASEEDIESYLSTMATPNEEETRTMTQDLFDTFDLEYEMVGEPDIFAISSDNKRIDVMVTQRTIEVNGNPEFQNNQATITHTLQYLDGAFKIVQSEVDFSSIEYIDTVETEEE